VGAFTYSEGRVERRVYERASELVCSISRTGINVRRRRTLILNPLQLLACNKHFKEWYYIYILYLSHPYFNVTSYQKKWRKNPDVVSDSWKKSIVINLKYNPHKTRLWIQWFMGGCGWHALCFIPHTLTLTLTLARSVARTDTHTC